MEKALTFEFNYSRGQVDPKRASVSKVNEEISGVGPDSKGTLAFLIEAFSETEDTEELKSAAAEAGRVFEEKYLASEAGTILSALEEALESIKPLTSEKVRFEAVAAVVWGLVLYVGKLGQSEVFLFRNGHSRKINFTYVASGTIQDGDSLNLVNSVFAGKFSENELDFILNQNDFGVVKARLDELQKDEAGSDTLILRIKVRETPLEEIPISFVDTSDLSSKRSFSVGNFLSAGRGLAGPWVKKVTESVGFQKGQEFFLRVISRFVEPWKKRAPGELGDEKARKKARALQVGVVLGVLLLISLFFSISKAFEVSRKNTEAKTLNQIEEKLAAAEVVIGINPEEAASILTDAANLVSAAKEKGLTGEKLTEKENRLNELLLKNKKVFPTEGFAEVIDLKSLNSKADTLVFVDKTIFSLEKAAGRLIKTNSDTKKPEVITEGLEGAFALALSEKTVYIAGKAKVWSYNTASGALKKILDLESTWAAPVDLATYTNNLYLVDPPKSKIWKHFGTSEVGRAQDYLTTAMDLSKATSLSVDGYIWIGTEEGKLFKVYSGKKQDFQLSGAEVGNIKDIFTTETSSYLYLLDAKAGRVLLFDKSGRYQNSYENQAFKGASGFFVQESAKSVVVASGSKIYQFKLR